MLASRLFRQINKVEFPVLVIDISLSKKEELKVLFYCKGYITKEIV